MRISTEKLPDSQIVLEIEVEPERVERYLDKAYRRLAQRTRVPGFRPGKVPRPVLERHLGRDALLREALDALVPDVYSEALREQDIVAIDVPAVEVKQLDPVVLRATVPVRPVVELGDYRRLRVPRQPVTVDPQRVDEALAELRQRYATWEPVNRPVEPGDVVRASIHATVNGRAILADDDAEFRVQDDAVPGIPEFAQHLPGTVKGQEREFTVTIPPDYPQSSLAGQSCTFRVLVKEVKEEKLPDLNDGFAQEVGEGFPTLQALRQRLESDLRQAAEAEAEANYREQVVDALVAQAQLEFPPILVERETERLLREQSRDGDMEAYLRQVGKTVAQVKEELRPEALERVQRSLVLGRLAELENVTVTPEEIDEEIGRMATAAGPQGGRVQQLFGSPAGRQMLERSLLTRKTVDRLVAIAVGQIEESTAAAGGSPPGEGGAGEPPAGIPSG